MRARVIYGLIGAVCILACGGGEPYVPKLNGGGGTASFSISVVGQQTNIGPGQTATYLVTVTKTGDENAAAVPVNFSATNLPAEATAVFASNPVTPTTGGVTFDLNVDTTQQIGEGTYDFSVVGNDGTTQKSQPAQLTITFGTGE